MLGNLEDFDFRKQFTLFVVLLNHRFLNFFTTSNTEISIFFSLLQTPTVRTAGETAQKMIMEIRPQIWL